MNAQSPYTERIWLMDLAEAAERFVAAIPAERLAFWDRVLIAEKTDVQEERPDTVYVVFVRKRRLLSVPIREALLRDPAPEIPASLVERQARQACEEATA